MLKKFLSIFFAAVVMTFASFQNSVEASDVWVGTSPATGWEWLHYDRNYSTLGRQ